MRSLRLLFLAAGLGLFGFLCARLGLGEIAAAVTRADPARFVAFLALSVGVFSTYALRWSLVLRAMSPARVPPALPRLLSYRAAEHAVSTLLPSAHASGEPLRALLLNRRGCEWPLAIASVAMDRVLDMTASSIAGPLYVGVFFLANSSAGWAAPWVMGGMGACLVGLAAFYFHAYRGRTMISFLSRRGLFPSVAPHLRAIDELLSSFVRSRAFAVTIALSILAELLVIAELWTLAQAFGLPISLPTLLGVMVGMGIAQLLPIPAAIGSLEATEVGVLTLAGGAAPLGLAVGLVIRLRESLWILVGLVTLYLEGASWRSFGAPAWISGNTSLIEPKE